MPNPYVILGAIAIVFALCIGSYFKGRTDANASHTKAMLEQVTRARETEQALQKAVDADTIRLLVEMQRVIDERDADIDWLRNRADRLPEGARANCKGATGGELSRLDAIFLIREAARADQLRAALGACYHYADQVGGTNAAEEKD